MFKIITKLIIDFILFPINALLDLLPEVSFTIPENVFNGLNSIFNLLRFRFSSFRFDTNSYNIFWNKGISYYLGYSTKNKKFYTYRRKLNVYSKRGNEPRLLHVLKY